MPDDHVIVKLDFLNAFNSLHRDAMLKAVADRVLTIYNFCHLSYSQPSILKFNNHRIMSEEGPQQRYPVGCLHFCNKIHPLLSQMKADLVEGYMDDNTLGGTRNEERRRRHKDPIRGRGIGPAAKRKKVRANPTQLHKCRACVPRRRHYDA